MAAYPAGTRGVYFVIIHSVAGFTTETPFMQVIRQVRHSQFLVHNAVFFFGSVAVGALNYLYYPVLGRLLTPTSFGEVQALISLSLQVAIFLSVLGLVTINIVTNYNDEAKRNEVVLEFEKLALCLSLLFLLITIIFQNSLKRFLQFDSSVPFMLLMLALVFTVPLTFRGAYLRGKQRFGLSSMTNVIAAGSKIGFSAALVAAGLGTAGAIGGFVLSQAVAAGIAAWWALKWGLKRPATHRLVRLPNMRLLAPELKYGGLVLVGSLIITLQYSIDVLVVKHYFDPHTAGLYAGVASVARIIFFVTGSIALVLMPMVKLHYTAAKNRQYLVRSMLLLFAVGLPALAVFVMAPHWVMRLLMGGSYTQIANLLPQLSVAIFTVSVINLVVSYNLALRRYAIAPIIIIGGAITYGLMLTHHARLASVVNSLLIGSAIMLCLVCVWAAYPRVKEFVWGNH